jgi:GDP-L-fucose synthase
MALYLAEIIVEILEKNISGNMINVGTGKDISMLDLINLIAKIVDYKGEVVLDPSKPNGMPRKVMQIDKMLNLGIKSKTDLVTGIRKTYDWYLRNADKIN